ncbi:hypothetical protein ACHAWO_002167 [Cyclotella atomus]|uniref:Uncharacterized protein n=1 Tax=Cyclotella atomus TaxID=382360 RepID=A0ABD3QMF9_9STRA
MKPDNRDSSNAAINDPNNDGDTSPESAALARGAAASTKHGVRAAASGSVGRLPVTAPTTVAKLPPIRSTIPKPSLPRPLPRGRAPVKPASAARAKVSPRIKSAPHRANQSIARASDRVSTGLDVWNAATTDQASNNDAHKGRRSRLPSFTQIAAFGRTFVTNTAMGMAVFATYEGLIDHFADQSTSSDIDDKVITANTENVPLSLHFFAGGLGGVSHSIVSLVLETKLSILNQALYGVVINKSTSSPQTAQEQVRKGTTSNGNVCPPVQVTKPIQLTTDKCESPLRGHFDKIYQDNLWGFQLRDASDFYRLDVVSAVIDQNKLRFEHHVNKHFHFWDATLCPFPKFYNYSATNSKEEKSVDLIHVRDVIQHLTLKQGVAYFCNVFKSGARVLIATTFPEPTSNPDIQEGNYYRNNLSLEPFSFSEGKCEPTHPGIEPGHTCVYNLTDAKWVEEFVKSKC